MKKQFLAVLLVIVLVFGLTGCRNITVNQKQAVLNESDLIPLILVVPDGIGGKDTQSKQKALLAHWDLKEGKLSLQEEPYLLKKRVMKISRD